MLRVVAEVLSPEKSTTVQLIEAIDKADHKRRPSTYPWSTITDGDLSDDSAFEGGSEEDDISEAEVEGSETASKKDD
ncbi:unnamed protein product [Heligmosomoides polygyrus]|uniref:Transposase n=1 Tax=Heligmosomoides polygyrus TaxID=6339 RepID=A0A183FUI4_HELPZ|nr:unnamed protein product [Heligmosomoides polygyrus]